MTYNFTKSSTHLIVNFYITTCTLKRWLYFCRLRASSCPDIYRNSMTTIATNKHDWRAGLQDFKRLLLDMIDFSHFSDPKFFVFSLSNFLLYSWYDVPYMYLADNVTRDNFDVNDGSKLISIIGIVNMFGEVSIFSILYFSK